MPRRRPATEESSYAAVPSWRPAPEPLTVNSPCRRPAYRCAVLAALRRRMRGHPPSSVSAPHIVADARLDTLGSVPSGVPGLPLGAGQGALRYTRVRFFCGTAIPSAADPEVGEYPDRAGTRRTIDPR